MESQATDDADKAALTLLAQQGLDMSAPLEFEFAIRVVDDHRGRIILDRLKKSLLGDSHDLVYDPGELEEGELMTETNKDFWPSWTVYVGRRMVPAYENLIAFQKLLKAACGDQGTPDGWNVEVC
ncbi:MAG: ribonuclease E inhibitor RraB [Planctomycetaceae bacterium]|jgi:hypothetical protein